MEEIREERSRHFRFFGLGSFVYAIFFTFCLYRNKSGITYPFFIGGTLFYFCLSLKKLEITVKKDSAFYIVSLLLLGLSTFMTDNESIQLMNKMGIFVLMFAFMIHSFHEDSQWYLGKYMGAILRTSFGSLRMIPRPFTDCGHFISSVKTKKGQKEGTIQYVLLGLVIAFPLLLFLFFLLASADMVFASIFENLFKDFYVSDHVVLVLFMIGFSFFSSYCILARLKEKNIADEVSDRRTFEPALAVTVTALMAVLYLVFCFIQIRYLFMGNGVLPDGYTYSEYAREGFFQLLFVCLINLCIVLICIGRFRKSKPLTAVITLISLCTFIMIASSAMRMLIYIDYYELTFLRVFVLWSLLVIFLLLSGVVVSIYRENFPLFRYSMIVVTALYLILSFGRVDYFIAKYNVSAAMEETDWYDFDYLYEISADAAPILLDDQTVNLLRKIPSYRYEYENYLEDYHRKIEYMTSNVTFRTFNLSRFLAGKYL